MLTDRFIKITLTACFVFFLAITILLSIYVNSYLTEIKIITKQVIVGEISIKANLYTYNIYDLDGNFILKTEQTNTYIPTNSKVLLRMENKYWVKDFFYNDIEPELINSRISGVRIIEVGDRDSKPRTHRHYDGRMSHSYTTIE